MATEEEIKSGFEAINLKLEKRVLDKCLDLCITYNIETEDFIDQWLAYTASNLNGAPPTLDALDRMERRELQKQGRNISKTPKTQRVKETPIEKTPVRPSNIQQEVVMQQTPSTSQINDLSTSQVTPNKTFKERSGSLSVQCEFGDDTSPNCFKERAENLIVKIGNEELANSLYMYEKFSTKRHAMNNMALWLSSNIFIHNKLEPSSHKFDDYFGEMLIYGRIYSDGSGKLDLKSLFLEGTLELTKGKTIKINVDLIDKFELFSGQVVVIAGRNSKKNFIAQKIYSVAPLLENPVTTHETQQIVVAAGPFTLPDNILFEPLEALLKYVAESKPNVLVLIGPFLDASHKGLDTISQSYDSFFEDVIDVVMGKLKGTGVQVVIIPSYKEIYSHPVFPSPAHSLRKKRENLICAPNPSLLDINGITIGASSTDILFHINKREVCRDSEQLGITDRMTRLASHILSQRSFYPLFPPDPDVNIDCELLDKYGMLEELPHVLILPSNLRHFIKSVQGCVVINPERLTRGQVAGTFARIEIRPGEGAVSNRVACQVLRI